MGYRTKYHNLKIIKYDRTPNGKTLKDKWAIVDGTLLVSAVAGLSRLEAEKFLPYYQKLKTFVFCG